MSFLKAEWRKLVLANYSVEEKLLLPYLPANTVLDSWKGKYYVSLVGFMFVNTRMLGLKIPWHVNFEEVNLRFYVKYNDGGTWKRGVVFIKEIVPRIALSLVANTLYSEHYVTRKMKHKWSQNNGNRQISYSWLERNDWQSIAVEAELESHEISKGGEAEFITEHYWGYTRVNQQKTSEYEVTHPRWKCYDVKNYEITVDFAKVYGDTFAGLSHAEPCSVLLAEGSEITVEGKRSI